MRHEGSTSFTASPSVRPALFGPERRPLQAWGGGGDLQPLAVLAGTVEVLGMDSHWRAWAAGPAVILAKLTFALPRPLSDRCRVRDITCPGLRVQGQRDQGAPLVGQEHPLALTRREHMMRVQVRRRNRPLRSRDMCTGTRSSWSRGRPVRPGPRTLVPIRARFECGVEGRGAGHDLAPDPAERRSRYGQR